MGWKSCVVSITHVAGKQDDLLVKCSGAASDASRLRRDLARILLSDATSLVVVLFSLIARHLF